MVLKHKFLFSFTCTTEDFGVSIGWFYLDLWKHPIFSEEVGVLFMTQLPPSQGTIPMVRYIGLLVSWPMCSSHCLLAARSRHLSTLSGLPQLSLSSTFSMGGGGLPVTQAWLLPLLLWFVQCRLHPNILLLLHLLGLQWTLYCFYNFHHCPFPFPIFSDHSNMPIFQCLNAWIPQTCLWGIFFLNYSCPTYWNFKKRDMEVFSLLPTPCS